MNENVLEHVAVGRTSFGFNSFHLKSVAVLIGAPMQDQTSG